MREREGAQYGNNNEWRVREAKENKKGLNSRIVSNKSPLNKAYIRGGISVQKRAITYALQKNRRGRKNNEDLFRICS